MVGSDDIMRVWFTSDTHFGAERTRVLSKRPFETVAEMDECLITNWNTLVGENDDVYHLGDFGDYAVVSQLNGKIHLIKGNYEYHDGYTDTDFLEMGFVSIHDTLTETFLYNHEAIKFSMAHKPSDTCKIYDCLFGHVHKLSMLKRFGLNVGTDCHNFRPINLDTVMFYINNIKYYDDEVFL